MAVDEEIVITQGDKEITFHRGDVGFDRASNAVLAGLRSGERISVELDYSETPAAYFVTLADLGLLSKNDPYTLDLMRKGCKSAHTANNWLKMHHIPMMRRLTNERSGRSHLGKE